MKKKTFSKVIIFLLLLSSKNALAQWEIYTPTFPDTIGINAVDVLDENIIWSSGFRVIVDDTKYGYPKTDLAFIGLTKDGGQTWETNNVPIGAKPAIKSIIGINSNICFLAAQANNQNAVVLKTENSGKSWQDITPAFDPAFSYVNLIHFYNANDGILTADPENDEFQVHFTENGGQTWELIHPDSIPDPLQGEFTNRGDAYLDVLWFTTSAGRIFRSTNKGKSWSVSKSPSSFLRGLSFSDAQNGIATSGYISQLLLPTKIIISKDGGDTWNYLNLALLGNAMAVFGYEYIPNSPFIMLTTCTGSILTGNFATWISPDRGASWQQISSGENIYHPTFISPTIGWGGEGQQLAYKTRMFKYTGSPLVGIFSSKTLPENWSISPNPCKDRFNLQIETDKITEYLLLINDLQGKLVYSTQFRQEGNVHQTIQFGSVPAGTYVVTLASKCGKVSKILEVQ